MESAPADGGQAGRAAPRVIRLSACGAPVSGGGWIAHRSGHLPDRRHAGTDSASHAGHILSISGTKQRSHAMSGELSPIDKAKFVAARRAADF
ncbi:hypothetical protein, partial [Puniceibacterium confluentis]|uniref:hypothetical protein n=1 Tax=Puniceibacterium confluentis TaxID=1958944 RepID=UPI00356A8794